MFYKVVRNFVDSLIFQLFIPTYILKVKIKDASFLVAER